MWWPAKQKPEEKLNILATALHEILMGAVHPSELHEHCERALYATDLERLEDVVNLTSYPYTGLK
jgi:hypothetical protein